MSLQVNTNNSTVPFIRSGQPLTENSVIFTDAGRATPLVSYTLMAKIAATQKFVPFTDETAVDGSAIPLAVYMGADIPAADIVAGDIADAPMLVGGSVLVDVNQLIIENSKTLATVVGTLVYQQTVKDYLFDKGIYVEDTVDVTAFENA